MLTPCNGIMSPVFLTSYSKKLKMLIIHMTQLSKLYLYNCILNIYITVFAYVSLCIITLKMRAVCTNSYTHFCYTNKLKYYSNII